MIGANGNSSLPSLLVAIGLSCGMWFALPVAAEDVVKEGRLHYTIAGRDGRVLGQATRVTRFTESWSRGSVLFASEDGDELVVESSVDYERKIIEDTVRTVKGDSWITLRQKLPFSGKTRPEADEEAQATRMEIFKLMPDEIEIATNAGSWKGSDRQWQGAARLELTKQLRRGTSFELLEMIERTANVPYAREIVVEEDQEPRAVLLDYLLYRPVCAGARLEATPSIPDCDFDERFGFPCSEKQLEKSKLKAIPGAEFLHY